MALKVLQNLSHMLKVTYSEDTWTVIFLVAPVWRVQIEEHPWPIVALDKLCPGQVLDDDASEAFVDILQKAPPVSRR